MLQSTPARVVITVLGYGLAGCGADPRAPAAPAETSAVAAMPPTPSASTIPAPSPLADPEKDDAVTVSRHLASVRRCWYRGLEAEPKMQGKLSLRLTVNREGAVTSIERLSGGGLSDEVIACIEARFTAAKFAAREGPDRSVLVPLVLTPN